MANTGRQYTHEQIIAILKEAEAAQSAAAFPGARAAVANATRGLRVVPGAPPG